MLRSLSLLSVAFAAVATLTLPLQAGMNPAPGLSNQTGKGIVVDVHYNKGRKHSHESKPAEPAKPSTAYLGDLCKARVIETGAARPSETWARSTALKAWKRKAVLAYGELYTDVKNAKDIVYRCAKAGVSGLTSRCEVAATPCRADIK